MLAPIFFFFPFFREKKPLEFTQFQRGPPPALRIHRLGSSCGGPWPPPHTLGRCRRWERRRSRRRRLPRDERDRAMRPQTRPARVEFAQDRQRSRGALEVAEMCSPVMGKCQVCSIWHFGSSNVKFQGSFFFLSWCGSDFGRAFGYLSWQVYAATNRSYKTLTRLIHRRIFAEAIWSASFRGTA